MPFVPLSGNCRATPRVGGVITPLDGNMKNSTYNAELEARAIADCLTESGLSRSGYRLSYLKCKSQTVGMSKKLFCYEKNLLIAFVAHTDYA